MLLGIIFALLKGGFLSQLVRGSNNKMPAYDDIQALTM